MCSGQIAQTRARQVCMTRVELAHSGHRGFRFFPTAFLPVLVKANAPALIWWPVRTHLRLPVCATSESKQNSISALCRVTTASREPSVGSNDELLLCRPAVHYLPAVEKQCWPNTKLVQNFAIGGCYVRGQNFKLYSLV